jgi:hypothetical protein
MKSEMDIQKQLQEMFEPEDIEWRVQQGGIGNRGPWIMAIPYITSRAVQKRLDDTVGIASWRNEYKETVDGMLCGLSLKIDGEWITKWDGAPYNAQHPVKGVVSDSLKRVAVQWGIGRYLYQLDVCFAVCEAIKCRRDATHNYHKHFDKKSNVTTHVNWINPDLPVWAIPHEDLSPFTEAMKEAESISELKEAFDNAHKYSTSKSDSEMETQFINCMETNKTRIRENFQAIATKQFEEIKPFIDNQIKMFKQMPTKNTLENNYNLAKNKLKDECKGKTFKHEFAFDLLEAAFKESHSNLKK